MARFGILFIITMPAYRLEPAVTHHMSVQTLPIQV